MSAHDPKRTFASSLATQIERGACEEHAPSLRRDLTAAAAVLKISGKAEAEAFRR